MAVLAPDDSGALPDPLITTSASPIPPAKPAKEKPDAGIVQDELTVLSSHLKSHHPSTLNHPSDYGYTNIRLGKLNKVRTSNTNHTG